MGRPPIDTAPYTVDSIFSVTLLSRDNAPWVHGIKTDFPLRDAGPKTNFDNEPCQQKTHQNERFNEKCNSGNVMGRV